MGLNEMDKVDETRQLFNQAVAEYKLSKDLLAGLIEKKNDQKSEIAGLKSELESLTATLNSKLIEYAKNNIGPDEITEVRKAVSVARVEIGSAEELVTLLEEQVSEARLKDTKAGDRVHNCLRSVWFQIAEVERKRLTSQLRSDVFRVFGAYRRSQPFGAAHLGIRSFFSDFLFREFRYSDADINEAMCQLSDDYGVPER